MTGIDLSTWTTICASLSYRIFPSSPFVESLTHSHERLHLLYYPLTQFCCMVQEWTVSAVKCLNVPVNPTGLNHHLLCDGRYGLVLETVEITSSAVEC